MIILEQRGRQSGKTTELIKISAATGGYILCRDRSRATHIFQLAKEMCLVIPFPITALESRDMSRMHPRSRDKGVLIDDIDEVLETILRMKVNEVTWNGPRR